MNVRQIRNLKPNQTEITLTNGTILFQSYDTIVAAFVPGTGYVKADRFYSVTTSKHINAWASDRVAKIDPAAFDRIVNS